MLEVFECIYGLLLAPEPEDPLDSFLAETFFSGVGNYEAKCLQMTQRHANTTLEEWRRQLSGVEEEAVLVEREEGAESGLLHKGGPDTPAVGSVIVDLAMETGTVAEKDEWWWQDDEGRASPAARLTC